MTTDTMTGAEDLHLPFPLQQSERVVLLCRRHWIHLWPKSVLLTIYALVPLLVISPPAHPARPGSWRRPVSRTSATCWAGCSTGPSR